MKMSLLFLCSVFCLFGCTVQIALEEECSPEMKSEITAAVATLNQTANMFRQYPVGIIEDVLITIRFTKANLLSAQMELTKSSAEGADELQLALNELIELMGGEFWNEHVTYINPANRAVLQEGILDTPAGPLKKKRLIMVPPRGWRGCDTGQLIIYGWDTGISDFDTIEMCTSHLSHSCDVPETCWKQDSYSEISAGYTTTHRLLLLIMATRYGCEVTYPTDPTFPIDLNFGEKDMVGMKRKLCERIYAEAQQIEHCGFPAVVKDLFLEQIALCGLEGYTDFARKALREKVYSWYDGQGCYEHSRVKRYDSVLENGCHTHTTAVGTGAMGFILRTLIHICFANNE